MHATGTRPAAYVLAQRLFAVCVLAALSLSAGSAAAQTGQLQSLRDDVRGSGSSSSSPSHDDHDDRGHSHSHYHYHGPCDDDDDFVQELCAKALLITFTSPWWVPHVMAGDEFSRRACFPGAPYYDVPGYLEIEPYVRAGGKSWGGHFQGEYADDFGGLSRVGGKLLLEHSLRIGIDTQWSYWSESLGGAGSDQLWTGDANVVFRFAQNERIAMRSGFGINWLRDGIGEDTGFNFTYGFDYFPCKPLVFSAEIDWGTLGDRTLFHARTTAGVVYGHSEAFLGYDYYDVGGTALNGFVAGVGFWF